MKKFAAAIVTIFLLALAGGTAFIVQKGMDRFENYSRYITTSGEIEKKYAAMGPENVSFEAFISEDANIGKFDIWYPSRLLESEEEKYPAIIFANGTGMRASSYQSFFKHLASWGFIVAGTEDTDSHSGISIEQTLNFLIAKNEEEDGRFSGKINIDKIGLGGYSQGGIAVYHAATKLPDAFSALYTVSTPSSYQTEQQGGDWAYTTSDIKAPILMVAGTGIWDAGNTVDKSVTPYNHVGAIQGKCPLWSLEENFAALPESTVKMIARKSNTDHDTSYQEFDGYMTAWFVYLLQDNESIEKAFFGENTELKFNSLYADVKNDENEFDNFLATIGEGTLTKAQAKIILSNKTDHKYTYSPTIEIERYDEESGEWQAVEPIIEPKWSDEVFEITKDEEAELMFAWGQVYGELPDGRYRIIMHFTRIAHVIEKRQIIVETEPRMDDEDAEDDDDEDDEMDEDDSGEVEGDEPAEPQYEEIEREIPTLKMRKIIEFEISTPEPEAQQAKKKIKH